MSCHDTIESIEDFLTETTVSEETTVSTETTVLAETTMLAETTVSDDNPFRSLSPENFPCFKTDKVNVSSIEKNDRLTDVEERLSSLSGGLFSVLATIDSLRATIDSLRRENSEMCSKIVALERAVENSSSPPKPSFKEATLAVKPKKSFVPKKKPSGFSVRKDEIRRKLQDLFKKIGFEPNGFRIVSPQTHKPSAAQIELIVKNFKLGDISPGATYEFFANMLDSVLVDGERLPFNVVARGVNNCSLIPKGMKTVPTVEGEFQTKFMEAFNQIVHLICVESEHMNWLKSLSNKDTPTPILLAHVIHYWNVMFPFVDTAGSLFKFNISHNGGSVKVRVYIDGMMWKDEHLPSYEGDIARDILRQINLDRTERFSKVRKVWEKADESLVSVEVSS